MPKRKGFLYEWMCDKEHIREAIVFGAKDKHDRRDVRRVLADVDGFTDRVYDLLQTQTFTPAQPKKRKIFDNSSRKWREIEYVPFFPDGIVHTLMVLAAAPARDELLVLRISTGTRRKARASALQACHSPRQKRKPVRLQNGRSPLLPFCRPPQADLDAGAQD